MSGQTMEALKSDSPKISDMVMCGDHPSFTKTELNIKETRPGDKLKINVPVSHSRITPTSSRTERPPVRAISELVPRPDPLPDNKALIHAALGSFRWPPYVVCVWALLLALTHALHALLAALDAVLPPLRNLCVYFRTWTEESWRREAELNRKVMPLALGGATGLLYALFCALYALHALARWATEPLCELEDKPSSGDIANVTNYIDDVTTNTSFGINFQALRK